MRILNLIFILLFPLFIHAEEKLQEKSLHFIVYFPEGHLDFANDVLYKAELYYKKIASDLGYERYDQFWLWENRVKIYLYPSHPDYVKATWRPVWSHGMADYNKKAIYSYIGSREFLETVLPHELGHLIFRDFIGFKSNIPLWLDEGVAQWCESERKRYEAKEIVKDLLKGNKLIPLSQLVRESLYYKTGNEEIVYIFYQEALSVVDFLITKYGIGTFTKFCRYLKDGKSLEEAIKLAYSPFLYNLVDLEKEWKKFLSD